MSFKSAQDSFETALHFAQTDETNPLMEHLIEGLIDLTKALRSNATATKGTLSDIKSKIGHMR